MRFPSICLMSLALLTSLFLAPLAANADDALIGSWKVETSIDSGEAVEAEVGEIVTLTADAIIPPAAPSDFTLPYEVDSSATPCTIDVSLPIPEAPTSLGIYKIEGDILTICIDFPRSTDAVIERPTDFVSTAENEYMLQTLSRVE